ncbi:MAG: FG-GAP repeat protein, partial [Planctomycetota bacterium]|nr:FG-GAP repeat protein [Planctomycetota bacterium]
VYVFVRSGGVWSQQAYIKASNTGADDWFGYSVALSADGNTLAVGAPYEESNATGIGGNQNDNSAADSGAVYLF